MNELVQEFLVESNENLDHIDQDLLALEKNPEDAELLSSIFRAIHTVKGTCGFLGFGHLEKVSHAGENLLSKLRDGTIKLNQDIANALLAMVDLIRKILSIIEQEGNDGTEDYPELTNRLIELCEGSAPAPAATESQTPADSAAVAQAEIPPADVQAQVVQEALTEAQAPIEAQAPAQTPIECQAAQTPVDAQAAPAPTPATPTTSEMKAPETVNAPEVKPATSGGPMTSEQDKTAPQPQGQQSDSGKQTDGDANKSFAAVDTTIRVDVKLLDKLMDLVGELVLSRNQILQFTNQQSDSAFLNTSQRLNLITTELQENVMKTRMQPINYIWNKFPRVVRDLSNTLGKKIEVIMEGKETEIDKSIIESIKDPLTHLVRNTVDHGIEMPDVRKNKGKPEVGRLVLRAYHEGGMVNIEISDDGGGIDVERIKRKALEKNLFNAEQLASMKDNELVNLIFMPGFSTAEKVTNISGRGVGMDVVKTNIEKIGGMIDVQSVYGKGTNIKIKIPLTLAIIPALIVTCGGIRYAIPQVNLVELVLLDEDDKNGIELIHDTPVYRLRGNLLSLVYLDEVLGILKEGEEAKTNKSINIVVVQANDNQFGLVVDSICDTQEIVVKPLSKLLKSIVAYAGATIMGDGTVALILDTIGLAQLSNILSAKSESLSGKNRSDAKESNVKKQTLLLFKSSSKGIMAVPLSVVSRLEEFRKDQIEYVGDQEVVQYREQIMPLIRLSKITNYQDKSLTEVEESSPLQVVVYTYQNQDYGIVVDNIIDIIEDASVTRGKHVARSVTQDSAIIQGKITEIINFEYVVQASLPKLNHKMTTATTHATEVEETI